MVGPCEILGLLIRKLVFGVIISTIKAALIHTGCEQLQVGYRLLLLSAHTVLLLLVSEVCKAVHANSEFAQIDHIRPG